MKSVAVFAFGAAALLGISACSSDKKLELPSAATPDESIPDISVPDISIPDISIPDFSIPDISIPDISIPDISIPTDFSFPANMSDDCKNFYEGIASAMTGGDKKTFDNLATAMDNLRDDVPEELRDDMDVVADAYAKLADIYAKHDYNFAKAATDPDLQQFFTDTKFSEASNNITEWLQSECGADG